jgi:uncharacterized Zn-binding protein involved in type VI secretion
MPAIFPACRLGDLTVTGDPITGPGVENVLIGDLPASVVGDMVDGAACDGAVTFGSLSILIGGRPATRVTSPVVGVNPETGVPVATVMAKGALNVLLAP